jgi:hypothetical protein
VNKPALTVITGLVLLSSMAGASESEIPVASIAPLEPLTTIQPDKPLAIAEIMASMESICQRISGKLASVGNRECTSLNMQHTGHRSVGGTPLLIKEYPPLGQRKPQARILLVGGTHGDELASISIVFKWMHTLEKHHSGLFHWRINPLMNPDGVLRPKHQRTNASGVDLVRWLIRNT